jgi:hypothetical protein
MSGNFDIILRATGGTTITVGPPTPDPGPDQTLYRIILDVASGYSVSLRDPLKVNAASTASINVGDSGAGADAAAVDTGSAPIAGADTSSGADAAQIASTLAITDSGAASDGATVQVTVAGADAATGSESSSVVAAILATDSASGVDLWSLAETNANSDSAGGSDSTTVVVALSLADSAAGSDAALIDQGSTPVPGSDSGAGADGLTASASVPASDTAAGSESEAVSADIALSDSAVGTDDASAAQGALPVAGSDTGAAVDALVLTAAAPIADAAISAEAFGLAASLALSDTATGSDVIGVDNGTSTPIDIADSAIGSDGIERQGSLLYGAPVQRWFEEAQQERAAKAAEAESAKHQSTGPGDQSTGSDVLGVVVSVELRDFAQGRGSVHVQADIPWPDKALAVDDIATNSHGGLADSAGAADELGVHADAPFADCAFGDSGIAIERRLARYVMDDQALMALGVF